MPPILSVSALAALAGYRDNAILTPVGPPPAMTCGLGRATT
jgi:hypothetical protein